MICTLKNMLFRLLKFQFDFHENSVPTTFKFCFFLLFLFPSLSRSYSHAVARQWILERIHFIQKWKIKWKKKKSFSQAKWKTKRRREKLECLLFEDSICAQNIFCMANFPRKFFISFRFSVCVFLVVCLVAHCLIFIFSSSA